MMHGLSRRRFLRQAATACAAPMFVPAAVLGRNGAVPPSEQIGLASIGLGFAWDTGLATRDTRLLAVCDVQRERRDNAVRLVNQHYGNQDCRAYNDFREVLARGDIDAVYVATPDHWHALVTIAAARAGKDVYCQKPLTHTVAEGQAVVAAVRKYGVVLQHGTQHRSEWAFRAARELVRGGYIGQLTTIRLGLPGGTQLPPQPIEPVPDGFDYEMWLGPARWAPYTTRRCFGMHSWYFISDYCVDCIRTRREPNAPVEVGHRSTTLCNIGTISMVLGRELQWDPMREVFPHDEEANRLLACPMRSPWQL
jgi:hypothetical protein